MLDQDYQRSLKALSSQLANKIEMPEELDGFFEESGPAPVFDGDQRCAVRTRVRTVGVIYSEISLPVFQRSSDPCLIYTCDFSRTGCGFLASEQYYPGEVIRVLLSTFWMRVRVRRSRRLGPSCFEVGAVLQSQHEPTMEAFAFEPTAAP